MFQAEARTWPTWLEKNERALLIAAAAAALVVFPFLGSYGLWDPQEFKTADLARDLAHDGGWAEIWKTQPPLTAWLVALSVWAFGTTELAARLPVAFLGFWAALATFGLGARLRRPRAGLFATLVLCASPLFVFQSRMLTTDIGLVAGSAIAMFGLVGVAWPNRVKPELLIAARASDCVLLALGLGMSFLSGGLVLGIFIPMGSLALVSGFAAGARLGSGDKSRTHHTLVALAAGGAAIFVLFLVLKRWGLSGYLKTLGAEWRKGAPPPSANFDNVVVKVAFGMFPWSTLAPLAVLRLAVVKERDRNTWAGLMVLAWCASAYLVATLWTQYIGDLRFPALVPIALAVGMMLDDITPASYAQSSGRMPLAAVFVLCAGIQLVRDSINFPEELAVVHLLQPAKYPAAAGMVPMAAGLGLAWTLTASLALAAPRPWFSKLRLWVMGGGWIFGVFLSLIFLPALSSHFSYKNVFHCFFDRRQGSERLGVMGVPGSGPEYYAHGELERLSNRQGLLDFLRRPERVFALTSVNELCPVHQAAGKEDVSAHILDCKNSRYILLSNQLASGEPDTNPLLTAIRRSKPENIEHPMSISTVFVPALSGQRGKIELLGYDMPAEVPRGSDFKVTLYFYVHEAPTTSYKIFMHFDGNIRFQGDHDPLGGLCGTSSWQAGDYITDTTTVTAGSGAGYAKTNYELRVGFFTGSAGNWRNMQVTSGPADKDNRVSVGSIRLR